jgi:hypothetical protein
MFIVAGLTANRDQADVVPVVSFTVSPAQTVLRAAP